MIDYIETKCAESYAVNGQGIERELYKRIYLDGVKTGVACAFLEYDKMQDEKMKSKCR